MRLWLHIALFFLNTKRLRDTKRRGGQYRMHVRYTQILHKAPVRFPPFPQHQILHKNFLAFVCLWNIDHYLRAPLQNKSLFLWGMTKSFHFNQHTHYACIVYRRSYHCIRTVHSATGSLLFCTGRPSLMGSTLIPTDLVLQEILRLTVPPGQPYFFCPRHELLDFCLQNTSSPCAISHNCFS